MPSRLVLFGLGNPGVRYRWTRHNLGFCVLDGIASERGLRWARSGRTYAYAECQFASTHVFLVKPMTYMNIAGQGLRAFRADHGVEPTELLVVTDDIALPFGQLRLRKKGSHGGHNGLRSVIDALETTDFPRLRLGVGPIPAGEDPADFVLAPIPPPQRLLVEQFVRRAISCIDDVLTAGLDRAMSLHNAAGALGESD